MNDTNKLIELLTGLVKGFIRFPADLKVTEEQPTKRSLKITFQANADDAGKLIGEQGAMIAALREIAQQMGNTLSLRVKVEMSEPVTGKKERGAGYQYDPDYKIDNEVTGLEAIGQFIFNDSAKVQYHANGGEKTTLVLLIDGDKNDFVPELEDALDVVMRATGLARGHKLAVEMDSL
jgi:predicted RNA-binding protein YlqC (UPF0109 family)